MGTVAAYIGVLLLVLGAPVMFLVLMIGDAWQRYSKRRELLQYYRIDTVDEWEVREYVRKSTDRFAGQTERLAGIVFLLIPVGWVIAAILYLIYGK